ncbi:unnamed protein product [Schistosoma margrebowiei]|uniref:Uncharacterized protein n=1 Tax=Schistosoma margrebowiei TaxID=48269 RepID=A0A3P8BP10_9TREM|nr:unnamed protein product [Schistosoma margrebowiei]
MDPGFVLLGTRQQGVPVILRGLVLPGGFDLVSPSFTVREVTTELYIYIYIIFFYFSTNIFI